MSTQRGDRLFWLTIFLLHLLGAITWFAVMPGGFPLWHPRFWANRMLPVVTSTVALAAVIAMHQRRDRIVASIAAAITVGWLSCAIVGGIVFPQSGRLFWLIPLAIAGVTSFRLVRLYRNKLPIKALAVMMCAMGLVTGGAMPLLQRAPPAGTRPMFDSLYELPTPNGSIAERVVRLNNSLQITAADGTISMQHGRTVMWLQPLLTFGSRSPDGCWTIFAPRPFRRSPVRELRAMQDDEHARSLSYIDQGVSEATLQIGALSGRSDGSCELTTFTWLNRPIFSHLNSFAEIEIAGHRRLSLAFSPCPQARIEVRPEDYPIGRPGRSAYVDAVGIFHIVEAHSGEKGPFTELARGLLRRGEPLTIEAFDDDALMCRITFDDWSAQADATLSPTAGWGLPTNAIEFHREGDAPTAACEIDVTLAATSVGRGWDTVAYAAGTYRNRMRVEFAEHDE